MIILLGVSRALLLVYFTVVRWGRVAEAQPSQFGRYKG